MLIRRNAQGEVHAIDQAHHAHLSGILAGSWRARLHARLVAAITLHDDPWRDADSVPRLNPQTGLPHDFIDYPVERRVDLYCDGLDALERLDSYVAFMVSKHYTTFAGTRDVEPFQTRERARRDRLVPLLDETLVEHADDDLRWMKYFDVLSLHICLTGPDVDESDLPIWLRDSTAWSTAPDGTELDLEWLAPDHLAVSPWPFAEDGIVWELRQRPLGGPFPDADTLRTAFDDTPVEHRSIRLCQRKEAADPEADGGGTLR
jgi:hypothetical protein